MDTTLLHHDYVFAHWNLNTTDQSGQAFLNTWSAYIGAYSPPSPSFFALWMCVYIRGWGHHFNNLVCAQPFPSLTRTTSRLLLKVPWPFFVLACYVECIAPITSMEQLFICFRDGVTEKTLSKKYHPSVLPCPLLMIQSIGSTVHYLCADMRLEPWQPAVSRTGIVVSTQPYIHWSCIQAGSYGRIHANFSGLIYDHGL